MFDLIRDSTFGGLVNKFSGGKLLPYRDQLLGYQVPERYLVNSSSKPSRDSSSPSTRVPTPTPLDEKKDIEATGDLKQLQTRVEEIEPFLVDWDGDDDPDNPR